MSVSPSVHLSTIQKVSQSVNKFNSLPVSQSTIQTVTVPFKSKLTVRCEFWFSTQFAILDSCTNWESRIGKKLSRIGWRIKSRGTENKRLTHDWFVHNFTKTYSCNNTAWLYLRKRLYAWKKTNSSCKENVSSRTSVSSFISSSTVSNACSKCKQCIFLYKAPGDSHMKGVGMPVENFELNP